MSQSKKRKGADFSDMSYYDVVAMIISTVVSAKQSDHPVVIRHGSIGDRRGVVVFMPGYEMKDDHLVAVTAAEETATD